MKLCELSMDLCPPVLTTESMRALDAESKKCIASDICKSDVAAGYELMKEAGRALYARVVELLPDYVAVFVGGGNNGGDGLVLAKLLQEAEIPNIVFSLAKEDKFKNEALLALEDFLNAGGALNVVENPLVAFEKYSGGNAPKFALIVDCMLGNGACGELRPAFTQMASLINSWKIPVLAADAPTGYDSAEHCVRENCVVARETMLFGFPRIDAYMPAGGPVFGNVKVVPLHYPANVVERFAGNVLLADDSLVERLLPVRNEWLDKRGQGTAVIVAGSANMPGAAALCTGAALRSGVGLVTLATPKSVFPIVASKLSEPVFSPFEGDVLNISAIPQILNALKHANAFAIGPGLSTQEQVKDAVLELLPQVKAPMVIDADALNILATDVEKLKNVSSAILTPHVREFARLFGELPCDFSRLPEILKQKATEYKKVIVLKGAPTFVALPNGRLYLVPCANSGMAKGGSGDVLTGILVALLSQGMVVEEAAVLGVLLHQRAGQIAKKKLGAYSMLPSDVIECLAEAF